MYFIDFWVEYMGEINVPLGYNIFRNKMTTKEKNISQSTYANEGITWHIRMLKLRHMTYTTLWTVGAVCTTALVDYSLYIFTDQRVAWLVYFLSWGDAEWHPVKSSLPTECGRF